jgi:hypothetical protein
VLEAAWQWRFTPAKDEKGKPFEATFQLGITFKLK